MRTLSDPSAPPHTLPRSTHAVAAGMSYLQPTSIRPWSYAYQPPPGTPWENCAYETRQMAIADARSTQQRPTLDREGFSLWDAPTAVQDFLDEPAVKTTYYREAAELALAVTGARQAYVFDHLVRRREADRSALTFGRGSSNGRAATNGRVHNDYTEASGRKRLELVLGNAMAAQHVRRYSIINIWRAINGPVQDTPLAVCDARTLATSDLVEADVRYPRRSGEIYLLLHSPLHRWHYFSRMDRHEALVFKQYDSQVSGVSRFTPHAAFDLPNPPPDAPLRESIELRCLVIHETED
ncbi:MAG TPA: CmcJ/NvfI family oxidoreductase [Burkholderiaceae bacterium]